MLDSLSAPIRYMEADLLEERKAKCEAAMYLADHKKLRVLSKSKFKQYPLVLKDEVDLFPTKLQILCTERMMMESLCEVLKIEDLDQAAAELETWTQHLFPRTNPSLGAVQILDHRRPSFTPIVERLLREDISVDDAGYCSQTVLA